jgi:hypothetical protein
MDTSMRHVSGVLALTAALLPATMTPQTAVERIRGHVAFYPDRIDEIVERSAV